MFLDLDFLKFDEFRAARLKEKFAPRFVSRAVGGRTLIKQYNEVALPGPKTDEDIQLVNGIYRCAHPRSHTCISGIKDGEFMGW